jgi:hypothetical protein
MTSPRPRGPLTKVSEKNLIYSVTDGVLLSHLAKCCTCQSFRRSVREVLQDGRLAGLVHQAPPPLLASLDLR